MGLYQSYLSVVVTGVIALSVEALLEGEKAGQVLRRGLCAIAMILAGVLLYAVMVKASCALAHVKTVDGNYNSITNVLSQETRDGLLKNIAAGYQDFWAMMTKTHFGHGNEVSLAQCVILLGALLLMIWRAVVNRLSMPAWLLLAVLLCAALPVGVNLPMLADAGYVHDLMKCGYVGVGLLVILTILPGAGEKCEDEKKAFRVVRGLIMVCMVWVIWQGAVDANQCFLKKDLGRQSTASIMTRIADDMQAQEGYVAGETPVLFVGELQLEPDFPGDYGYLSAYTGVSRGNQITYQGTIRSYFKYILQLDMRPCSEYRAGELLRLEQVLLMPAYPDKGAIQLVEDTLIVKLN